MSINEIVAIAGKHLGKAGDGTAVAPYVTPDKHDKELLVPIPRELGRKHANISSSFVGYESWHAYEMSFLRMNGMPCTGVLKISYPATSVSMVESKSLKLYLNSFDQERLESVQVVEQIIMQDLSDALGADVKCKLHIAHHAVEDKQIFNTGFANIDDQSYDVSVFTESPELLEQDTSGGVRTFHTANLRSLCEITRQKDTGNSYILIRGERIPTEESLTKFVFSLREAQHFHENVTEIIFDTLMQKFEPTELLVANIYNRRGGIDIHSIRANTQEVMDQYVNGYDNVNQLFKRTLQQ